MQDRINSIADGNYLFVGVGDEGGFTKWTSSHPFDASLVENTKSLLERLGSKQIRNYNYRDTWAIFTQKGNSNPQYEFFSINQSSTFTFDSNLTFNRPSTSISFRRGINKGQPDWLYSSVEIHGPAALNYNLYQSFDLKKWYQLEGSILKTFSPDTCKKSINHFVGYIWTGEKIFYEPSLFYKVELTP